MTGRRFRWRVLVGLLFVCLCAIALLGVILQAAGLVERRTAAA